MTKDLEQFSYFEQKLLEENLISGNEKELRDLFQKLQKENSNLCHLLKMAKLDAENHEIESEIHFLNQLKRKF